MGRPCLPGGRENLYRSLLRLLGRAFASLLSLLLFFEQFLGIVNEILPVAEEDLLELVWIAAEVAEERDPIVELVEIGVLANGCFNYSILDGDRDH